MAASTDIDVASVETYKSNIDIKYQQVNSRVQDFVRVEYQQSNREYYDRIGPTAMTLLTVRHAETPIIPTVYDRRAVTMRDYVWADYIDRVDRVRMLADPTGPYTRNAMAAVNRQIDMELIGASTGTATGGHDGTTLFPWASFTSTQQVPVNYVETGSATNSNLTVPKVRQGVNILKIAEAVDEDEPIGVICSQSQINSLLRTTEVTNTDYASVKALVSGTVNSFMGCTFKRTQLTLLDSGGTIRSVLMFPQRGMLLAMGIAPTINVDVIPQRNYSVQVHMQATIGATRIWEQQMVEILCDETK